MPDIQSNRISEIISRDENLLLDEWVAQISAGGPRGLSTNELRTHAKEFLGLLVDATRKGDGVPDGSSSWGPMRDLLESLSREWGTAGYTPSETATFVFSFKKPLFARIREVLVKDPDALFAELWTATRLLDQLGLLTTEAHQRARDEIIRRQQQDMLELSTPVVKLWDGVLALPMIGTLDSQRTQIVMETLLQSIADTGAQVAIVDITGVPTVDTLVAQHLLKTVSAARLMGAECIISGVRPQIAQTIVHLGVALGDVVTKATLADAFAIALERAGARIVRNER
jgi:rsbT co-antagonist protein RsbR